MSLRGLSVALVVAALALPALAGAAPLPVIGGSPIVPPGSPDVVYLPGLSTGSRSTVWRTVDAGATLRVISSGLPSPPELGVGALELDPTDASTLYASMLGRDVWRSRDAGETWERLGDVFAPTRSASEPVVDDIAITAAPDATLLAVVGPGPGTASSSAAELRGLPLDCSVRATGPRSGVYRREGEGWRQVLHEDVWELAAHPTDPRRVYAFTGCGSYRSDDGGATFAKLPPGPLVTGAVLDPADPDVVLGTDGGFQPVRSVDAGRTWRVAATPLLATISRPSPAAPERLIGAVLPGDDDVHRLVVSDDFGWSWRPLANLGRRTITNLTVAPSDPARVYAGTIGALLTSTDGGQSWAAHGAPLDDVGPRVGLADPALRVQRVHGGRSPARVHVALRLDQPEPGWVYGRVRLVVDRGGRSRSAWSSSVYVRADRVSEAVVTLPLDLARAVRRSGPTTAMIRISATDDTGADSVRWVPATLSR